MLASLQCMPFSALLNELLVCGLRRPKMIHILHCLARQSKSHILHNIISGGAAFVVQLDFDDKLYNVS